jgi:uncharacterized membrane protein YvbJ
VATVCPSCGSEIPQGSLFCPHCGKPANDAKPSIVIETVTPPARRGLGLVTGLILFIAICVLISAVIKMFQPSQFQPSQALDLNASVTFTGTQFKITNNDN